MKRRLEYIMTAEEHGDLTNIIGTVKCNTNMLIKLLKEKDVSKEQLISFLEDSISKLEIVDNILRNYEK